jgi:large subunit ribosomal protein L43
VRNLKHGEIMQKCELLLQSSGEKNTKIRGKNVVSENENIRGIWSPFHGGVKDV